MKISVHKGLKDVGLNDYDMWEMAVHLLIPNKNIGII